ncbi:MAG: methyltransferase domain-containing protein [Gemmatimonadota bacterium]
MDQPDVDPAHLDDCLDQLARLSVLSGARRLIWDRARSLLPADGPVTLVDVGAGGGDILRHLSRGLGDRLRLGVGLDFHERTAMAGARRSTGHGRLRFARADARALPLAPRSADLVMMHMALHHIEPRDRAAVLAELGRVSRGAVLVTDLARNALNRVGARILTATVWRRNPLMRVDAPVSVDRSLTSSEFASLAAEAGLGVVRITSLYGHRLALSAHAPARAEVGGGATPA